MLVINPDECIDCGVCEPECPVEAIKPEAPELLNWVEINREYAMQWPVITKKKDAPADADEFKTVENKYETLFSPNPGSGD